MQQHKMKGNIMNDTIKDTETFEEFKNSFFYGKRSNLNFKFLSHLSQEDAGHFFDALLNNLSQRINDADIGKLYDFILEWQAKGYHDQKNFDYDTGPFVKPVKPLSTSTIGLLTSSGHFREGDDPNPLGISGMTQEEAEKRVLEFVKEAPVLSTIPIDTDIKDLRVRHGGYDVTGAKADPDVAFPLKRLKELLKDGKIGAILNEAYSFIGACSQIRLLKKTGPEWVEKLKRKNVDALVLVPV